MSSKFYCKIRKEMMLISDKISCSDYPKEVTQLYSDIYEIYYMFMKKKIQKILNIIYKEGYNG